MRKHSKFFSISEFCKSNGLQPIEFYEILSRHPELAKKLKSNAKGERLLDERSIKAAGAILRKIEIEKHSKSPMSAAAVELNLLAAKNEELRKEVVRLRAENEKLKNALRSKRSK